MSDDRDDRPTLMLIARRHAAEPSAKLTAALERTLLDVDPEFDRRAIVSGVSMRQNSMADFLNQFALSGVSGGVTGRRVIGLILFDVVKLVAPGVVVGLVVTVAIVRVNGGITVSTIEPLGYVAGAAIAMLTAIAASLAPARRAASVQPMVAMRST